MTFARLSLCLVTLAVIGGGRVLSQDSLMESSTEKRFPVVVAFTFGDTTYTLEGHRVDGAEEVFLQGVRRRALH